MYLVSVVFGPNGASWGFLYKDEDSALSNFNLIKNAHEEPNVPLIIDDDFSQIASINRQSIHGVMIEDLEVSKVGQIERGLHQARTQAKAQTMAQQDPIIRAAATAARGPSVLSPMPQGYGPNGPLS